MLLILACVTKATNYVVCIGVADYPGANSDLLLSSHDAETMKTLYEKNGNAVTDVLMNEHATVENVMFVITNMFSKATTDDAFRATNTWGTNGCP